MLNTLIRYGSLIVRYTRLSEAGGGLTTADMLL